MRQYILWLSGVLLGPYSINQELAYTPHQIMSRTWKNNAWKKKYIFVAENNKTEMSIFNG